MFRLIRYARLLFIVVALLVVGIGSLIDGAHKRAAHASSQSFKAPITLTCDAFVHSHPKAGWYSLTGCQTNALGAIYASEKKDSESSEHISGSMFVPMGPTGSDPEAAAPVALVTTDDNTRSVVQDMQEMGLTGVVKEDGSAADGKDSNAAPKRSDAELRQWANTNESRIVATRAITGMVRTADDYSGDDEKCLKILDKDLTPNPIIFEEGLSPMSQADGSSELQMGAIMTGIGVLAVGGFAFFIIKGMRS